MDDALTESKGILSGSNITNPGLAGASRVFLPYCNGDLWSGQQRKPVDGFIYAGHLTLMAALQDMIYTHGLELSSKSTVILTGMSAGGVGTFNNLDKAAKLLAPANVVGMPGGGYFMFQRSFNRPSYSGFDHSWGNAARLWGSLTPIFVDESCAKMHPAAHSYKCLEGPTVAPHITSRTFVAENQYDPAQMYYDGGDACPGQWDGFAPPNVSCAASAVAYLRNFGRNMSDHLQELALGSPHFGIFSPSCVNHVQPFDALWDVTGEPEALKVNGSTLSASFRSWLHGNMRVVSIEGCANQTSPCNANVRICPRPCL